MTFQAANLPNYRSIITDKDNFTGNRSCLKHSNNLVSSDSSVADTDRNTWGQPGPEVVVFHHRHDPRILTKKLHFKVILESSSGTAEMRKQLS